MGDEPWSSDFIGRILASPGSAAFVACDASRQPELPVGFVLTRVGGDECEILSLGVKPAARGQGIGHALLSAVDSFAANHGAASTVLEVAEDNTPAIALYLGRGFGVAGRRPGYYLRDDMRVDALILRCDTART